MFATESRAVQRGYWPTDRTLLTSIFCGSVIWDSLAHESLRNEQTCIRKYSSSKNANQKKKEESKWEAPQSLKPTHPNVTVLKPGKTRLVSKSIYLSCRVACNSIHVGTFLFLLLCVCFSQSHTAAAAAAVPGCHMAELYMDLLSSQLVSKQSGRMMMQSSEETEDVGLLIWDTREDRVLRGIRHPQIHCPLFCDLN